MHDDARGFDEAIAPMDRATYHRRLLMRRLPLLSIVLALLAGCGATTDAGSSSFRSCDRNGDQEQRAACDR